MFFVWCCKMIYCLYRVGFDVWLDGVCFFTLCLQFYICVCILLCLTYPYNSLFLNLNYIPRVQRCVLFTRSFLSFFCTWFFRYNYINHDWILFNRFFFWFAEKRNNFSSSFPLFLTLFYFLGSHMPVYSVIWICAECLEWNSNTNKMQGK